MVLVVKNLFASAGDIRDSGSLSRSGRSPGEGHRHLLSVVSVSLIGMLVIGFR